MVEPDELESLSAGTKAACSLISNRTSTGSQNAMRGRHDHSEEKQSDHGQRKERTDTRETEKEREWGGEAENRAIMARAQTLSQGR
jgi:hypothetical protein